MTPTPAASPLPCAGAARRRSRRLAAVAAVLGPVLALPLAASASTVAQGALVSATPSTNTPAVNNGHIEDITQAGGKTFLGGDFTSATSARATVALPRTRVLAFDARGVVDPGFAPVLDKTVYALLPGAVPGTVYVGGAFSTLNGGTARKLLLLDTTTGLPVPGFAPPVINGVVNDVKRVGNRLYIGGTFTRIGTAAHAGIATLDATTGALDPYLDIQLAGHHSWTSASPTTDASAPVGVTKLAIDPKGTRLVAVGNFKTVDGTDRDQAFMVDLTGPTAALADWQTNRYDPRCYANAYDSWIRDVDFAPDGTYFVIAGTGGYPGYDVLCDAAARWETAATGSDLQPTWVDWTGGDTLLSVAVSDTAVYVGGHQRWMNNAYASDWAGPGAVARPGLAALDPTTGVPLSWNPGRNPRGVGAAALFLAPEGLYVGSDTNVIGNGKTRAQRKKIAMFPLAGGSPTPATTTPALPGTVVQTGNPGRYNVLYRLNEGGPTVAANDAGPAWTGDSGADAPALRNSGSNTAGWSPVPNPGSVPAGTPSAIFDSERWDPNGGEEMSFHLAVPTGTPLTVRVYFANRYTGTGQVGQRVFDVDLDGTRVLPRYDIVKKAGDQTGTYEEFTVPAEADGSVDLTFVHEGADNPLVNGIEVLDAGKPGVPATATGTLTAHSFTGGSAGQATATAAAAQLAAAHGAFVADGALYYGSTDGTLHERSLDGSTDVALNPYHDSAWETVLSGSGGTYAGNVPGFYAQLGSVTSMAYAKGRLYYTLAGDRNLYSRYFSTESGIVGPQQFTADSSRDWSDTTGMFLVGSTLYVARTDGNLYSLGWSDASVLAGQPVGGHATTSPVLVSGTGDWGGRALWLQN